MKRLLLLITLFAALPAFAQFTSDRPDEYSDYMVQEQMSVAQLYVELASVMAYSDDPNAVNGKRMQVVQRLDQAIDKIGSMGPFEGSTAYRDDVLELLKKTKEVYVGSYVELTELVGRKGSSIADLEVYYLKQEKVEKELGRLEDEVQKRQARFAGEHTMDLKEHPLQEQMERIGEVSDYSRVLFMEYLAIAKENENFMNALNANDAAAMKKARAGMLKAANPVLGRVLGIKAYKGNWKFRDATLKLVNFYNDFAEKEYQLLIEFMEISDTEPTTQEEVDKYNAGVENYNMIIERMNSEHGPLIDNFNQANKELMQQELPAPTNRN